MTARAGLVLRGDDALHFVPADVARCLVAQSEVTKLPGADLAMALVTGEVIAVLPLGTRHGSLVVCSVAGEHVAFSGLTPEASGFFEQAPGGVAFGNETALELDVQAAVARVERELGLVQRGWLHASE